MSELNFEKINAAALKVLPALVKRWLPDGYRDGNEWVALNPCRDDLHHGSFKVNLVSGKWADFAIPDVKGRGPISLAAYLFGLRRAEAARRLAQMLGVT
ncbi:MAG: hypothetical protein U0795_00035 [Pirellulales bacterium]